MLQSLSNGREANITAKGRRSGRDVYLPVWFVLGEGRPSLWLLPTCGSRSPWFRNLEEDPALTVQAGGQSQGTTAVVQRQPTRVRAVSGGLKDRCIARESDHYYRGVEVAVEVPLNDGH